MSNVEPSPPAPEGDAGQSSAAAAAPDASPLVKAATVAVSVNMRFLGSDFGEPGPPPPDNAPGSSPDSAKLQDLTWSIEDALHVHLQHQKAAIADAAIESMTELPGAVAAEVRVMRGSIEILVIISFAAGLLRKYNEFFGEIETATGNTRRLVERLADAFLVAPPSYLSPSPAQTTGPAWHAATSARWWLAPAVLAAAGEQARVATQPTARTPRLPAIDFRTLVLWAVGVVTFLTGLYVAASILLELFAD
jgi:hypothetical protein